MTDSTLMNSLDEVFSRAERLVEEQGWDWYLAVQHCVNGPSPEEWDQSRACPHRLERLIQEG